MRCTCCNAVLNDFEATRKVVSTQEYLDCCNACYAEFSDDVLTVGRTDLNPFEYIEGDLAEDAADIWLFDNDPDW